MEYAAELEGQMVESISSSRLLREFSLQDYSIEKTEKPFVGFLSSSYRSGRASIRSNQSIEMISGLSTIALLWLGSSLVCRQFLTPGELMSFYAMLAYIMGQVALAKGGQVGCFIQSGTGLSSSSIGFLFRSLVNWNNCPWKSTPPFKRGST